MKMINLNAQQATELFNAFNALDGYDGPAKVKGEDVLYRIPYKLGSIRRVIVKNLLNLKERLDQFDLTRKNLLFEAWPDGPKDIMIQDLKPKDFPDGAYKKFEQMVNEAIQAKDETAIELVELPYKVIYDSGNEFPLFALAVLEDKRYGLIGEPFPEH